MPAYERIPIDGAWTYRFDAATAEAADELAHARHDSVPAETVNSSNFFGGAFPDWYRHRIGTRGEYAMSAFYGCPVDTTTIGRGDDGTDFPGRVQMKAVWHRSDRPPLPLNRLSLLFNEVQYRRKGAAADCFVLGVVAEDFGTVTLLGAIEHVDLPNRLLGPKVFNRRAGPALYLPSDRLDAWLPRYVPAPAASSSPRARRFWHPH